MVRSRGDDMATLNEALTWAGVCKGEGFEGGSPKRGQALKAAFLDDKKDGGHATLTLVKKGTMLYKFTQTKNHQAGKLVDSKGMISPWWSPTESLTDHDVGLRGVLKFAKTVRVNATEYVRLIAAINPDWGNALDMVLQAKLLKDVYGFWGQAANQAKGNEKATQLTGRVYQLWVPNLVEGDHIAIVGEMQSPEDVVKDLKI
jgi:hypothetical protein